MKGNHEYDNFCQIIGTGTPEPRKGWHHSGLLLVVNGKPYLIDVTSQNWDDFGDWLFHEEATFLVTHGHSDHFDAEEPWRGIFNPNYANFGRSQDEVYPVHLYGPWGVIDLLLRFNGFHQKGFEVKEEETRHILVTANYHQLERLPDGRMLHLHGVSAGTPIKIDGISVTPFDALHDWSYPIHPPHHVERRVCVGYVIDTGDKRYLYMPDFHIDSEGKLESNIIQAMSNRAMLDYFIVGCTNPVNRKTATPHSGPEDIYRLYENLRYREVVSDQTTIIFTHRNPHWERYAFENPGFPEDRLLFAWNGEMVDGQYFH